MSKEAMKLALEAFSVIAISDNLDWIRHQAKQQAAYLQEALAEQPAQQEPVAWATQLNEYAHIKWGAKRPEYPMVYEFPLYTSPPAQRKPLTDEQIEKCFAESDGTFVSAGRAIEAAHGIKE